MAKLHGHQLKQKGLNAKDKAYATPIRLSQKHYSQWPMLRGECSQDLSNLFGDGGALDLT